VETDIEVVENRAPESLEVRGGFSLEIIEVTCAERRHESREVALGGNLRRRPPNHIVLRLHGTWAESRGSAVARRRTSLAVRGFRHGELSVRKERAVPSDSFPRARRPSATDGRVYRDRTAPRWRGLSVLA